MLFSVIFIIARIQKLEQIQSHLKKEKQKMKRHNNTCEKNYFTLKCGIDGTVKLSIDIPIRLFYDIKKHLENSDKVDVMTTLYEEYSDLSDEQKDFFQFSIYEFADEIIDTPDLVKLLLAVKKVTSKK